MEIDDITREMIEGKQIVVVKFPQGHCLTFLVDDVEEPEVPGYPACSLTYFRNIKKAHKKTKQIYRKLNYKPKNHLNYFVTRYLE